MHVHHIELSHNSNNISGGEQALLEVVKYISLNTDWKQTIYTSESGMRVYQDFLKDENVSKINYVAIGSIFFEKIHPYFAYYIRVFQQLFHLRKFSDSKSVIFSHEEFLPTILYSYFLKKINKDAKWVFFYHMKPPSLFKGFLGEFSGENYFPDIKLVRYILEHKIAFLLTKTCNIVLTVNEYYKNYLESKYSESVVQVLNYYSGVSLYEKYLTENKLYDFAWMGRFHRQKGIDVLMKILEEYRKVDRNFKLVVIGGGNSSQEEQFKHKISEQHLDRNIDFKGFVLGHERFKYLAQARIFLMTSLYESFGQVVLEALKYGLPVIMFNLPVFKVFNKGVVKVKISSTKDYSKAMYELIHNKTKYEMLRKEAFVFSRDFSWEKTAAEVVDYINKL